MIVLSKEQIEEMVDPDQMMDQIEEAYRIYGSGEFSCICHVTQRIS